MPVPSQSPLAASVSLTLGLAGFTYPDLYDPARLADLSAHFDRHLLATAPETHARFKAYAACQGEGMTPTAVSEVLVETAPHVGAFVARLFGVEDAWSAQRTLITNEVDTVIKFRSEFVVDIHKRVDAAQSASWDAALIRAQVAALGRFFAKHPDAAADEESLVATAATKILSLQQQLEAPTDAFNTTIQALRDLIIRVEPTLFGAVPTGDDAALLQGLRAILLQWCYLATKTPDFAPQTVTWVSFKHPAKTNHEDLVETITVDHGTHRAFAGPASTQRRRVGFSLTDPRFTQRRVLYEVDHCIYCHDRDTDSCSKGMRNKKDGTYKVNALGVTITGCPLGEKISEMHLVKRQGDNVGALALVVIDNPMCPGTGHRICNDCMKGCIYQKTEPVNIPQIETNVLTDVLFMPWGFEIYSLLTRWNPLNVKRPHALPYHGKKVLVVGLGPAGYTLAHYMLNEGFGVVAIDALKLEPLASELVGDETHAPQPVRDFKQLYEDLDKRTVTGFGGVAEYGITARWDKNFLKVMYLNLLRRQSFRAFGGVRFGGTLTLEEAWDFGFDHVALATGAGKPSIIGLKNNLMRGIRKASDFLMGLQLTGAAKDSSMANLQVRLPAGVIGGGLTAIDTSTEVMAYYPKQVAKILRRYEQLVESFSEAAVRGRFDREELMILDEFLTHGRAIEAERTRAASNGETPNFAPLVKAWGGVTLFYRKELKDAPAYRQNHEEIHEALAEGMEIAEGMNPVEAIADEFGALSAVKFEHQTPEGRRNTDVPLRSLFIAAGTSPNIIYEQEHPGTFTLEGKFFKRFEPMLEAAGIKLDPIDDTAWPKIGKPAPFTSYQRDGRYVTFYGDNHPVYAGNVVKAMASAKDGYPYIAHLFAAHIAASQPAQQPERDKELKAFFARLVDQTRATVVAVNRLTPNIIEVIARAPLAASKFRPGQFYRVQNLEAHAPQLGDTVLASEGIALTGAWVDPEQGLVSLIALEMGTSSRLCSRWLPGEQIVVMGVTGSPTVIPREDTVLLVGGGLGNAVLFSIGKALRAAGNRVIYFAGYKRPVDVFKVDDIEEAADLVVWTVDRGPDVAPLATRRPQDRSFVGNIVEAMVAYAKGELGPVETRLADADELIVIGSDAMMAAVKQARKTVLAPFLKPTHRAIGSINSPMQCMMKGVCAQCLCKHVDPNTGEESFVYSCYNQDQDLERVDFGNLRARLRQNTVQEKLGSMWLDYLLVHHEDNEPAAVARSA